MGLFKNKNVKSNLQEIKANTADYIVKFKMTVTDIKNAQIKPGRIIEPEQSHATAINQSVLQYCSRIKNIEITFFIDLMFIE